MIIVCKKCKASFLVPSTVFAKGGKTFSAPSAAICGRKRLQPNRPQKLHSPSARHPNRISRPRPRRHRHPTQILLSSYRHRQNRNHNSTGRESGVLPSWAGRWLRLSFFYRRFSLWLANKLSLSIGLTFNRSMSRLALPPIRCVTPLPLKHNVWPSLSRWRDTLLSKALSSATPRKDKSSRPFSPKP